MKNLKNIVDNYNFENIRKIINIYGFIPLNDNNEWNYKLYFDDFIQYIMAKNDMNENDLLFDLYCYDYYENEKQYFMIIHYFNYKINDYSVLCLCDFDVAEIEINFIENKHIINMFIDVMNMGV